jgi:integrase
LNAITRTKTVFKFGYEMGDLDLPPRYGQGFKPPSRSVLRRHKAKAPPRTLEADQLRQLINAADVQLRAMMLLGLNCGFGNGDCAALPLSAVNLETGWINFPRPKTGIPRRCPLWPETVETIRGAIAKRPKPAEFSDVELVFLNYRGTAWVRMGEKSRSDYLSHALNALVKKVKLARAGLSFYSLRHVFRTVADAARDIPAVREIMGHVDAGIDATYRERIDDARLKAVTDHVRAWLWPLPSAGLPGRDGSQ